MKHLLNETPVKASKKQCKGNNTKVNAFSILMDKKDFTLKSELLYNNSLLVLTPTLCNSNSTDIINNDNNTLLDNNITIASFDFEGTLIKTKSNSKFPINATDSQLFNDNVLPKLETLFTNPNYFIVIFSNYLCNSEKKKSGKLLFIQTRVRDFVNNTFNKFILDTNNILTNTNINNNKVIFLFALNNDKFRKPNTGMWEHYINSLNLQNKILQHFYVGDAAGRKNDFANSDLLFSKNCNITNFYTPEEYFTN